MVAATGPTVLWYLARGSGLAALVVLTLGMVLGLVMSVRWTNPRWPRFVVELLHRNASLIALGLVVIHVAAVVIDAFAPIGWLDAVIPFLSPYRPVWLGLGAIAFDLLGVIVVTSLVRDRIGHRTWRALHWFAYLCWPLVVVHGLATGSDTKVGFVLVLTVMCVAAVLIALWWRLAVGWREHTGTRVAAGLASVVAPVVLVAWLPSGPLATGWARNAGTPASVLAKVGATSSPSTQPAPAAPASVPSAPFNATLSGSLAQSVPNAAGEITIRIDASLGGGASGTLVIVLTGQPVSGGGVLLASSQVGLGPVGQPSVYRGTVTSLRGTRLVAPLRAAGRPSMEVTVALQVAASGDRVTGTVAAQPLSGEE
ncbi:MAG TPA: ferric reductase-like transmembrane domain-containing protein [Acidimicrobiia bacterium]|nr:ferric reductase-like transmembrane domain-containing protein [Acidimicrobiia bacterium]